MGGGPILNVGCSHVAEREGRRDGTCPASQISQVLPGNQENDSSLNTKHNVRACRAGAFSMKSGFCVLTPGYVTLDRSFLF